MNYEETVQFLFERQQKEMKLGLETMQNLVERLGHPEKEFPSVHIAGTNGKGSTAALLESILRQAGYRTGLYTSPHLVDMRERIQIGGDPISEKDVVSIAGKLLPHAEAVRASYFEILTAMAFSYFADQKIDIAVLEVGIGGRLDATNIVRPILTLITQIGLEHTKILGRTLSSIAKEKAGIFKPGVPAVAGTNRPKINTLLFQTASEKNVPLAFSAGEVRIGGIRSTKLGNRFSARTASAEYKDLNLRLAGRHQIENARLVLSAVDHLRKQGWDIPEQAVRLGFEKVVWRARLEMLRTRPDVLLDSAHNPSGIRALVQAIRTLFRYDRLILVFGVLDDKNYRKMLGTIAPLAETVILTKPKNVRALDPKTMESLACLKGKTVRSVPDIEQAWRAALKSAKPDDLVCGTGSIYFVGEALRLSP